MSSHEFTHSKNTNGHEKIQKIIRTLFIVPHCCFQFPDIWLSHFSVKYCWYWCHRNFQLSWDLRVQRNSVLQLAWRSVMGGGRLQEVVTHGGSTVIYLYLLSQLGLKEWRQATKLHFLICLAYHECCFSQL